MTHPGEQFYPEGVHWDDPIARGTLPDLLSKAAADYGDRPAIEFRTDTVEPFPQRLLRRALTSRRPFACEPFAQSHRDSLRHGLALQFGELARELIGFFGLNAESHRGTV